MWVHSREADGGLPKHGWSEIKPRGKQGGGWSEIITLLCFRENVRNVVPLVAPGIHINRREKDAESCVNDEPNLGKILGNAQTRSEVARVRIFEAAGKTILSSDKNRGHSILENQIGVRGFNIHQRIHVIVSNPGVDRGGARHLKSILNVGIGVPLP